MTHKFTYGDILMLNDSLECIAIHKVSEDYYYFDCMKNGESNFLPHEEINSNYHKVGEFTCDPIEFSKYKFEDELDAAYGVD